MTRSISRIRRNVRDYGYPQTVRKGLDYLIRPVYQAVAYRVYGLNLESADVPEPAASDRFAFRLLSPSDVEAIGQVEQMAEWYAGNLGPRIEAGSLCTVALDNDNDRVAAFNLVSTGLVDIPIVKLRWSFRSTEAWSEHIATHHNYRKLGLATMLRFQVIGSLKDRGFTGFYGATLREHPGTLKLARRVGFVEIGDLKYSRVLTREAWSIERFLNEDGRRYSSPFDRIDQFSANELSL